MNTYSISDMYLRGFSYWSHKNQVSPRCGYAVTMAELGGPVLACISGRNSGQVDSSE